MNDVSQTGNLPIDADRFGEGFAAGCRLLQSRYQLPDETAFLIVAAATATAIGPTVRVRDPLGGDLPPSLNLTFCATSRSPISAALSDAFRVFREAVGQKAVWRENVGSRRLRTDFLATLTALEAVEQQLRHAAPLPTPPAYAPFPTPDQDDTLRRTKPERENRLAHRDVLRTELGERRMDLAPFLVVEDPGWDTVLALDKLAFDNCLTSVSPDGAAFRELLASTPKRIGKIARLLQASRRGHSLTDGTAIILNPVVICLHVAEPGLLAEVMRTRSLRRSGLLHGTIVEVPDAIDEFDAAAFVDDTDEQCWLEFIHGLFAGRVQGYPKLYLLDERGFNILEDFRRWCQTAVTENSGVLDLLTDWPGFVLKLALCLHLAAGKGDEEILDLVTVGTAAELMKSVGAKQIPLLERLTRHPASTETKAEQVAGMVVKLDALGGTASMRDLFRCYSGQDYAVLAPILNSAVEEGRIERDAKRLWLPEAAEASTSTRQR